jgi:ankyrin repeat protein
MNETKEIVRVVNTDELQRWVQDGLPLEHRDEHGRTLLMVACRQGALDLVRWLLEAGSDPNARSPNGTTPLMYAKTAAFAKGDTAILELLVRHGADVSAADRHGRTALDYAERNAAVVVSFLRAHTDEENVPRTTVPRFVHDDKRD